ncbi:MAG: hypothetical protein H0T89_11735 [Deltaproteobacteria bacterium]|nr:hypothetical protein [Deltaproteobacteria bacterium]MDQ3297207.1 hypothetical protein [Myxococcota bacterium]
MSSRVMMITLGIVLSAGTVFAQAPAPAPVPVPDATSEKTGTDATLEKTGTSESLTEGGDQRPWAAGVSIENQRAALELFREGNQNHNDGIFVKAVELYRAALKHWDHPAINYNLALSLTNLDQPIEVEASLQKAIRFGPAPLEKGKFEHAKQSLLLIEKQLATIEVSCQKEGARVSVDNKEIFVVEPGKPNVYKARVRIGKHTFVAEKPGYATGLDAPFIGPGETFRIELKLYTAEELTRYKRRWDSRWVPFAVMGGGVVAGLVGGAFTLSAQSSYDELDAEVERCNDETGMNGGCEATSNLTALRDSGDSKRTFGYVMYGVAGAAVVTGAVLLYLNRSTAYQISSDEYRREQLERDRRKVTVTPIVAPTMAGAMLQSSF